MSEAVLLLLLLSVLLPTSCLESVVESGVTPPDLNQSSSSMDTMDSSHLLIGAFNIRKFGLPKLNNLPVLRTLVKIVLRYDLIAVSEITDRTERAMKKLMAEVNYESTTPYHYVVSSRVGRTNNKEQYALIYRPHVIQVKSHFLYNDSEKDSFAREPLIATLRLQGREEEVGLVSIHVKPTDAVAEITALTDVHDWIERRLKIKDIIILGDFNGDCQYVPKKAWKTIGLRNISRFHWLIGDEVDTTVGNTNCSYDRIVISGPFLRSSGVTSSGASFKFDSVYGLDAKTALLVSDHYPVEFQLRPSSGKLWASDSSDTNLPTHHHRWEVGKRLRKIVADA